MTGNCRIVRQQLDISPVFLYFNLMDVIKNTVIGMVVFIIAGAIHEFSHAFSAYILGDDTARLQGRLTLNPVAHIDLFGSIIFPIVSSLTGFYIYGWMKPVPVTGRGFKNPARDHAVVAFAGPLSNLLQATAGIIFLRIIDAIGSTGGAIANNPLFINIEIFFQYYFIINILLFTFNLFPCPPLDGGWILRYLLPGSLKNVFDKFYRYGFLILFILLFTGISGILLTFMVKLFYNLYTEIAKFNFFFSFLPFIGVLFIITWIFRKEAAQLLKKSELNSRVDADTFPEQILAEAVESAPEVKTDSPDKNRTDTAGELSQNCKEENFKKDNYNCLQCSDYMDCLYKDIHKREK